MGPDTWISAASAVAAFAALGLALWEGTANRRHSRLTVRPWLRCDFSVHPEREVAGISLANAGLGPAIFTDLQLMLDGRPVAPQSVKDIGMLASRAGIKGKLRYGVVLPQEILPAGATLQLLEVCPQAFALFPNQDLNEAFRRIGLRVRYQSIYGEAFVCLVSGSDFYPPAPGHAPAPAALTAAVDAG
jgi:hypothetical protein